jgi:hypothetical protein
MFFEDLMTIKSNNEKVNDFYKYFEKNYISLGDKFGNQGHFGVVI